MADLNISNSKNRLKAIYQNSSFIIAKYKSRDHANFITIMDNSQFVARRNVNHSFIKSIKAVISHTMMHKPGLQSFSLRILSESNIEF